MGYKDPSGLKPEKEKSEKGNKAQTWYIPDEDPFGFMVEHALLSAEFAQEMESGSVAFESLWDAFGKRMLGGGESTVEQMGSHDGNRLGLHIRFENGVLSDLVYRPDQANEDDFKISDGVWYEWMTIGSGVELYLADGEENEFGGTVNLEGALPNEAVQQGSYENVFGKSFINILFGDEDESTTVTQNDSDSKNTQGTESTPVIDGVAVCFDAIGKAVADDVKGAVVIWAKWANYAGRVFSGYQVWDAGNKLSTSINEGNTVGSISNSLDMVFGAAGFTKVGMPVSIAWDVSKFISNNVIMPIIK